MDEEAVRWRKRERERDGERGRGTERVIEAWRKIERKRERERNSEGKERYTGVDAQKVKSEEVLKRTDEELKKGTRFKEFEYSACCHYSSCGGKEEHQFECGTYISDDMRNVLGKRDFSVE